MAMMTKEPEKIGYFVDHYKENHMSSKDLNNN